MGKTYELGYIITPLLPEDKAVELVEARLKGFITKNEGVIKSDNAPKMIPLAYSLHKVVEHKGSSFTEGYFGAIRFELSPEAIVSLRTELKKIPELIRTLIITLPKDYNKVVERRLPPKLSAVKPEEKAVMTEEAIDKEIDSLLTPTP